MAEGERTGAAVSTRRQVIVVAATALGLAPLAAWVSSPSRMRNTMKEQQGSFTVQRTDDEWRAQLSPEAYVVLREHSTERAHTSPLNGEKREGTYVCAGCGNPLFSSAAKFDSGSGWPSFVAPLDQSVGTSVDRSYFMVRTEVHCARCGSHLGHVFPDGPPPGGLRYCMNGVALGFVAG